MEFRILGPLEVADHGVPVAIGGPKPRALLAALLLHPGLVLSCDRLVQAAWGEDPPPKAEEALRSYMSRLRAVLPPQGDGPRLRYRAPGYQLTVGDGELDAARFEQLVTEAREHAADDGHERTLALLDTALGLWRGEPLAEFDPVDLGAQVDIARLAGLRLMAAEQRAEALLRLGRSREVVAELESLAGRFPQEERLTALLMRALYDCGRQADALTVYQGLRRLLVEELGVEPSQPTQQVHQQLLTGDPGLGGATVRRPTNLPHRGIGFVGREREVAEVGTLLRRASLVTLVGVGGVGKSRMALEVADGVGSRFPDGVWLSELAPLPDGGPVGHAVAAALRLQQRHGLTVDQTVIEYLEDRKLLLVLDNCEHVLDAAAHLLDRVLSRCPGVVVIATSREALGVGDEQLWPMEPLSEIDATTLFVQRARAIRPGFRPDRVAQHSIAEICRRLDGLPLAIELVAARMRVMGATEMAQRLDDERLHVPGRRTAQPRHRSLTAALDWSYRLLSEREQQLFARLSVFAGGADLAAVHAICAEPGRAQADTLELLTALVDKSMVTVSGVEPTRYRVLETLRAYGRENLSDDGALSRRHAAFFVVLAEQAARGVQGPAERTWVERTIPDLDNLRAAFLRTMADGDADQAIRLVTSLPEVSQVRLGYEPAEWAERALELTPGEHPLFAAGVGAAARGAWNVGDFSRARRLVALAAGQLPGPGTARPAYPADVAVDIDLYEGDVAPALRHYTSEVTTARRHEDPIRLVWALYYVAICHAVQRRPELGVPVAEECLAVAETTANPTARSMARYALGLVLKKRQPDRALSLFDEAAELSASVRNFWWQGIALMEAAATRAVHCDPAGAAAPALLDVLDHWDRVGDWTQQWLNLRYVVRLLRRIGCDEAVVVLHHCMLAHGKSSPLDASCAGRLLDGPTGPTFSAAAVRGSGMSAAAALQLARSCLRLAG